MDKVTSLGVSWVHSKVGSVGVKWGGILIGGKLRKWRGRVGVFFFPFSKGIIIGYGDWNEYRRHIKKIGWIDKDTNYKCSFRKIGEGLGFLFHFQNDNFLGGEGDGEGGGGGDIF